MKRYWLIFLWIFVVFYPEDCIWAKEINGSDHGVTIKYNETVMAHSEGLFIRFDDVKEDSRCPRGVNCFWAGNAKLVIEVYKKDTGKTMLQINSYRKPKEVIYEEYKIRFLDLSPYPEAEKTIKMSEYMLQLNIEEGFLNTGSSQRGTAKRQLNPFAITGFSPAPGTLNDNIRNLEIPVWKDIGVKWIRDGQYNKQYLTRLKEEGINFAYVVDVPHDGNIFNNTWQFKNDLKEWRNSIRAVIKKYADVSFDTPTISYFQLGNEIGSGFVNNTSPLRYALALRLFYRTVKEVNPSVKVILGSSAGIDAWESPGGAFNPPIGTFGHKGYHFKALRRLKELEKIEKGTIKFSGFNFDESIDAEEYKLIFSPDNYDTYFDVIDFHVYLTEPETKNYSLVKENVNIIKQALRKQGFRDNIPFWITELGAFTEGAKLGGRSIGISEKRQALFLIKSYVQGLSLGINPIFWFNVFELEQGPRNNKGFGFKDVFNYTSMIHSTVDSPGSKKLSYYAYKKMVDVLDGSDWGNILTIRENNGVYVYRFTKQEKPIWVVWSDNPGAKTITLDIGSSIGTVKVTHSIPKYKAGKKAEDYNTAFETKIVSVISGKASLNLSDEAPVYIEGPKYTTKDQP